MKAIILAAGYGTRLGSLTKSTPKALLRLAGRPVIDWLLDALRPHATEIHVVSNLPGRPHFEAWRPKNINLLDDGSTGVHDARGALCSLDAALRVIKPPCSTLVVASDTVYLTSIHGLVEQHRSQGCTQVAIWSNPDPRDRQRRGNVDVSSDGRLLDFEEKPSNPLYAFSTAPLYVFSAGISHEVRTYLGEGGDRDSLGRFIRWLVKRRDVRAWTLEEAPLDIGNLENLARAQQRTCALIASRAAHLRGEVGGHIGERSGLGGAARGPEGRQPHDGDDEPRKCRP